jgi:hypothetical protein
MKRLFLLLCLMVQPLIAQTKVEVADHEILTNDTGAAVTLKEFFDYADKYRVDYLTKLKGLKEVRKVDEYKTFVGEVKDGVLYFTSYVDKFPNTKRILVLHLIGRYYGLKPTSGSSYKVMNEHIIMNERTEQIYINRRTRYLDMKDLIKQLEEIQPLNTQIK